MIMNKGIWVVELLDDGTLDTVIECTMRIQPSIRYTFRANDTSEYRDPDTGELSSEAFDALVSEACEWASDCHRDWN